MCGLNLENLGKNHGLFYINVWNGGYADSLMHNTIVAEMIYRLEPNKMGEVIKVIVKSLKNLVCLCKFAI
ncbi:hypothetical protein Hanom_Chr17g01554871 [Helianthus anomalus]